MAVHEPTGLCTINSAPPNLANIEHWIAWHLTHEANLPSIVDLGALLPDTWAEPSVDIGEPGIKANRRVRETGFHGRAVVADYVPFYWTARSPMMYREVRYGAGQHGGGSEDLVLLGTPLSRVIELDLPFCISNGNASQSVTQFTNSSDEAQELLELPPLLDPYWQATLEQPDKPRRRQAELLVYGQMPLEALDFIVTSERETLKRVRSIVTSAMPHAQFAVRPSFFYS